MSQSERKGEEEDEPGKLVNDGRIFRRQHVPAKDVRDLFCRHIALYSWHTAAAFQPQQSDTLTKPLLLYLPVSLIKRDQRPPNTRNKYLLAHGLISKTTVGSLEAVSEAVIQADSLL